MDNRQKYNDERDRRWNMAKQGEPRAIEEACAQLTAALGQACCSARYDELWFDQFDPGLLENSWVRGAPDYVVAIGGEGYLYTEIKIKAIKFEKTMWGGTTQNGSRISRYGCKSFYLDRVPVYENMCAFSQRVGIAPESFLLLFVSKDMEEVNAISLAEIQELIENGYCGQPFCEIKDGYGTKTQEGTAPSYLVPEKATHPIGADSAAYFRGHMAPELVLPPKRFHASNLWYYHSRRSCTYLSKQVQSQVFESEEQAAATGRRRCTHCFGTEPRNAE